MSDPVDHPAHYTKHPAGVECIDITEHMNFCTGNAVKYLWRAGAKDPAKHLEDLKKAVWYIQREIARLEKKPADREYVIHVSVNGGREKSVGYMVYFGYGNFSYFPETVVSSTTRFRTKDAANKVIVECAEVQGDDYSYTIEEV